MPPSVGAALRFSDEAKTINRYVRRLRRREVQAIVVLLHEGGSPTRRALADDCPALSGPIERIVRRTSSEVDAFLTGHTHGAYNCVIDGRRVTAAGSFGRLITRIELDVSRRTQDVVRVRADNWVVGHDVMRAPRISELIARYARFADPLRLRVIGRMAASASRNADRSGEHRMGNLVADAQQQATGADAAFVNPGELRTGLAAGDVSFGRAYAAQPFGSSLVVLTLTGGQVMELLRQQWCDRDQRRVLQPSGSVTYTWSATVAAAARADSRARRRRIRSPTCGSRARRCSPAGRYRVTVSSLLAGGFNRFRALAGATERGDGPGDTAALEAYLAPSLTGAPLTPPATDRITVAP